MMVLMARLWFMLCCIIARTNYPQSAPLRPGIVHRLDKDTSGVMVIAKTEAAHLSLADQFANRQTSKVYQAIACGKLGNSGEFNQPIARHPTVRIKMAVSEKGKSALTLWKTKRVYRDSFHMWNAKF